MGSKCFRLMEGDLRFVEADPALSRVSADGRGRSFSEPPEGGLPSKSKRSEASMHGPARTASASSELPLSSDSEVGPHGPTVSGPHHMHHHCAIFLPIK